MAAAAIQQPQQWPKVAEVNGLRFNISKSDKYLNKDGTVKKTMDHIIDMCSGADIAFRIFQFCERTTKIVVEILVKMGSSMAGFFKEVAGKFLIAWTFLTIPRLPSVTKDALSSLKKVGEKNEVNPLPGSASRKVVEAVKNTADALAMYLYTISLFAGNMAWKTAGDVPDLINNVADAQLSAQDMLLARKHIQAVEANNLDADIHNALVHTQRYSLLKLMKAICSVASGVLGLALLALGGPILPAIALIAVSLASTVFAVMANFYKTTNQYKMVEFFNREHVQLAPARA